MVRQVVGANGHRRRIPKSFVGGVCAWLEPAEAFMRRKVAVVAALGARDQMNRHGSVPVVLKYKALKCTVAQI